MAERKSLFFMGSCSLKVEKVAESRQIRDDFLTLKPNGVRICLNFQAPGDE